MPYQAQKGHIFDFHYLTFVYGVMQVARVFGKGQET